MTTIRRECLKTLPIAAEAIEKLWNTNIQFMPDSIKERWIGALCLSHERLRVELEGATILLNERKPANELDGIRL